MHHYRLNLADDIIDIINTAKPSVNLIWLYVALPYWAGRGNICCSVIHCMSDSTEIPTSSLTPAGKYLIIIVAFLGWFFGGMHMAITSGSMRSAAKSLYIQSRGDTVTKDDNASALGTLKKFDTDEDGHLSGSEVPLAFFDEDTNSVLSSEEIIVANFKPKKVGVLRDENEFVKKTRGRWDLLHMSYWSTIFCSYNLSFVDFVVGVRVVI